MRESAFKNLSFSLSGFTEFIKFSNTKLQAKDYSNLEPTLWQTGVLPQRQ